VARGASDSRLGKRIKNGQWEDGTPATDLMTEIRKQNEVAMRERLPQARKGGELSQEINVDDYTRTAEMALKHLA
jgi:hypothetical protein